VHHAVGSSGALSSRSATAGGDPGGQRREQTRSIASESQKMLFSRQKMPGVQAESRQLLSPPGGHASGGLRGTPDLDSVLQSGAVK
jgi:hypothetical protein